MEWSNLSFSQQQTVDCFTLNIYLTHATHLCLSLYIQTHGYVLCMYAWNIHLCISTHTYLDMLSSIVLIIGCQCYSISLKYLCWYLPKMSFYKKIWEKDSTSLYQHQMTAALTTLCVLKSIRISCIISYPCLMSPIYSLILH